MVGRQLVLLVGLVFTNLSAEPVKAAAPPGSTGLDTTGLAANTWVEISQAQKPEAAFCSTWYLPATDEFFLWGKIGGHREESKRYEAQVLKLGDGTPEWTEAFPPGKEPAWANGRFPNWGCGCHRLAYKPQRPWLGTVFDSWLGNAGAINVVRFVETDGITRPTRALTHHQAAYDSKRGRLVYYAGGKTFAYDPQKRAWTDLQAKPPLTCEALAWASMAYDPVGDQIVLFGGAYALNPWGGARTWLFDCAEREWRRAPVKDGLEPMLRCCAQLVYDSKNKAMVLFGGDALDRFLADTWVLDPATLAWTERKPEKSPPPLGHVAACFIEKRGLVLLVSPTQRGSRQPGGTWTYDAAKNVWTPLTLRQPNKPMEWISCAYSVKHDAVVLAAPGVGTWVCRLDPATAADPKADAEMVSPGTWAWNTRVIGQTQSILTAPPPDRAATEKRLKELPVNTVVDAEYPGHLISKTWSSATMDTDRGIVVYIGGGHSGYTGNDCALYDVGANRWAFDAPPSFFPFLRNYNASLYGWDYQMRATSQHTYRWYCYDPVSKLVAYCARPAGPHNGFSVLLEEDESKAFAYDEKKHGYWTFLYDPVANKRFPPLFGRPFRNSWALALVGTPQGVFAKNGAELYHGKAAAAEGKASIEWTLLDKGGPPGDGEFQPLIYDSKRGRLLFVAAKKDQPLKVWEHSLAAGEWKELPLKRSTTKISREIVYDARSDSLLALAPETLLAMDFESLAWRELDVAVPKGLFGTECAMVYDPMHEVSVLLIPISFSGKMQVGLFRYDPRTAKYRQEQHQQ